MRPSLENVPLPHWRWTIINYEKHTELKCTIYVKADNGIKSGVSWREYKTKDEKNRFFERGGQQQGKKIKITTKNDIEDCMKSYNLQDNLSKQKE